MADPSPLAGLLDRAGHVFHLAWQLGRTFQEEHGTDGGFRQFDPTSWNRNQPAFNEFCAAVLDLRDAMQNPPDGFGPVAQALLEAAGVAKRIRDTMQTADGRTWASFLGFFPELNSVGATGREAIQQVTKARRLDDPFAFVDQAAAGKGSGIDTTPTLPRPPQALIEAAARGIPGVLANVQPTHDGAIELIASHLAMKLQNAKHTLAAVQWAIHESIQGGRLRAGLVEVEMPSWLPCGSTQWQGGKRGTIAIPEGKPAPFNSFNVIATELLWTWWRSLDAAESTDDGTSPNNGQFVERLLAGPDNVELSPREMALLEAHLRQPVSFATIQQEKQATGHSTTEAARNKLTLIRDFNRGLQDQDADEAEKRDTPTPAVTTDPTPKRSTERGEGRAKLIAALTKHHQYADGGCLNLKPIGNNELAKAAGVSPSTASAFFNDNFQRHTKYKVLCRDAASLAAALKLLNGEFVPYHLLGAAASDVAAPEQDDADTE